MIGTLGKDTFTGTSSTYANADRVIDSSKTDIDSYNVTVGANSTPDTANVENINVTTAATTALTVSAGSIKGASTLTVIPGDVVVGGETIKGSKVVTIDGVSATETPSIVAGAGATNVFITQLRVAGVNVNADTASGNVNVIGAATVKASGSGLGDTVTVTAMDAEAATSAAGTTAALGAVANALPVSVTTNAATVTIADDANGAVLEAFTGSITIVANSASTINVAAAGGGVNITDTKASATINVSGIDDCGAIITAGSGTKTTALAINLGGTTALTDTATVSASGLYVNLDADNGVLVDTVNLSGNGAAVTFTMTSSVPTKYVLTGDQDVTVSQAIDSLTGVTVADSTTAGTTTVKVTGALGADRDLSKIAADVISIAADIGSTAATHQATFLSGANIVLAKDQAELAFDGKKASSTLNITVGDDTAADGSAIEIDVGAAKLSTNISAVNLVANIGDFVASGVTLAATGTMTITGEGFVDLGTVTGGKSINAAEQTGGVSLTTDNGGATLKSITTGAGDDTVDVTSNAIYTVNLGEGDNELVITAADDTSSFATGAGSDAVSIQDAGTFVVVTGEGDDTVTIGATKAGVDSDALIVLGAGSDKVIFAEDADASANANFAMVGVETIEIGANAVAVSINAASFAQDNTFKLVGNVATDTLTITNTSTTAGATIDASGVTFSSTQDAALVLVGASKLVDTITGSAKADSITLTSGGDVISGGSGVDTLTLDSTSLVGATIETASGGTSTGIVINLGSTAITNASVIANSGNFLSSGLTTVESGKTAYLFAASASTNTTVQATISGIENVVGTTGIDYIVGSAAANSITGGTGADFMTGGAGADTFVFDTDADGVASTANTLTALGIAATDTVTFTNGVDVISDFVKGTDKLDVTTAATAPTDLLAELTATALTAGTSYIAYGTYNAVTATFTIAAAFNATTAKDAFVITDGDGLTAVTTTGVVILDNLTAALTSVDFV